ncbi:protein unc-13 homolog [Wolffia australiana]
MNGIGSSSIGSQDLPSPFGELRCKLSREDLLYTAYEIFVGVSRVTGGRPLTYIAQAEKAAAGASIERSLSSAMSSSSTSSSASSSLHRSLTSSAAHQVKRALGLKPGSLSNSTKKLSNIAELMRVQLGISEQADSRIRRGLLRISAGKLGRRIESILLPLELLQQLRPTDFPDQKELELWQKRYLKILEAGLLLHPHLLSDQSDFPFRQLQRIIHTALDAGISSGSIPESLQSSAMVIATKSPSRSGAEFDTCHWADGLPLNLHLYQILLESCFDSKSGSVVDEADELIDNIKKTWSVLGLNQSLHNLCFMWTLFKHFAAMQKMDPGLVTAAETQLDEIAEDDLARSDPVYSELLDSTLTLVMNWAEQRLLAYHDSFSSGELGLMRSIVSLGVTSSKILAHDHRHQRRDDADVARARVDNYIRSSVRTAFAQMMEQADMSRRSMKDRPLPILSILAKDVSALANKEKELFSPLLNTWHPLAAAVAMSTLHVCFGWELNQFIAGITELSPDAVRVLKSAEELERELVQIAVEDSAKSDDGGKAIIREMLPFESEPTMARLTRAWIRERVDSQSQLVNQILQRQVKEGTDMAPAVDFLRTVEQTVDDFFQLPIPMHQELAPELYAGLDKSLQICISKSKAWEGSPGDFFPELPPLTRCGTEPRLWGKKDKLQTPQKVLPNQERDTSALTKLCAAINTLHHIRSEVDRLEKRGGVAARLELAVAAGRDETQRLCETLAARIVFVDLRHVFWDGLYIRDGADMTRAGPLIRELDLALEKISSSLHNRVRNRAVTALMKSCLDGFLVVILAGGPRRRFTVGDSTALERDLKAIKELFLAEGDGLPEEVVDKAAKQARDVLSLFGEDSEAVIQRFRRAMEEKYGVVKGKMPMPPTTGRWSSGEPNTLLRVLCHRDDEIASKFLKKTYGLPKKI